MKVANHAYRQHIRNQGQVSRQFVKGEIDHTLSTYNSKGLLVAKRVHDTTTNTSSYWIS